MSKQPSKDTELRELVWRFCRTEEAADNLVKIIERYTAEARIEEIHLAIQGALRQDNAKYFTERIKQLTNQEGSK